MTGKFVDDQMSEDDDLAEATEGGPGVEADAMKIESSEVDKKLIKKHGVDVHAVERLVQDVCSSDRVVQKVMGFLNENPVSGTGSSRLSLK